MSIPKSQSLLLALMSTLVVLGASFKLSDAEASVVQVGVMAATGSFTPSGTAFFVSDDGLIMTADHVYVSAAKSMNDLRSDRLVVRRANSTSAQVLTTPIDLVKRDPVHDLAILKLQSLSPDWKNFGGMKSLTFTKTPSEAGEKLCSMGYFGGDPLPGGLCGMFYGPSYTSLSPNDSVPEILVQLQANQGQSGSPVLRPDTGEVVGILLAIVPAFLPSTPPQPIHSGLMRLAKGEYASRLLASSK